MRLAVGLVALLFLVILPLSTATITLRSTRGDTSSQSNAPLLDEVVTLNGSDLFDFDRGYYLNLTGGQNISINISVNGYPIDFGIYNSTADELLLRQDITSLNEQWTVPRTGEYEFAVAVFENGLTTVHITVTLSSGGGQQPPPQSNTLPMDEQFSMTAPESKDFYANLTGGDRISINVSVTGSPINFSIYDINMHEFYFKMSITSLHEDWTVPIDDDFDFYFQILEGTAQVHFTVQKSTTQGIPLDLQFSMDARVYSYSYRDFYANLTSGDRISINVSVNGDQIVFQVYNSSETSEGLLLEKRNVTSVNEEWTAPYSDRFDFYFEINEGNAQIHFTAQKITEGGGQPGGGGGLDPLPIIVVVVVVLVALVSAFLIIRMRRQPQASVLPPPPPPPSTVVPCS